MKWHIRVKTKDSYAKATVWQNKSHKGTLVFTKDEWDAFRRIFEQLSDVTFDYKDDNENVHSTS